MVTESWDKQIMIPPPCQWNLSSNILQLDSYIVGQQITYTNLVDKIPPSFYKVEKKRFSIAPYYYCGRPCFL